MIYNSFHDDKMNLRIKDILSEKNALALPNLLSFIRFILIPIICFFIGQKSSRSDAIALILIFFGIVTDFFDGIIARRFHLQSNLGRILDPVGDKLGIGIVMFFLVLYKSLPLWYYLLVIGRDIGILLASIYLIKKRYAIRESNIVGKYTVGAYALVLVLYLMDLPPFKQIAIGSSLVFMVLSTWSYGMIFYRAVKDQ